MRIRQEANIEDEVGVFGDAFAIAKTDARDQDVLFAAASLEARVQQTARLVNVELRGVDDQISERLHRL